jgi:putative endonuclease
MAPRRSLDPQPVRHCVYIVRCADSTLYTGYAKDPHAREAAHNSGRGARYTSGRRPVRLVYSEMFDVLSDALRREYELKQWPRARKEALIARSRRRAKPRA